MKAKNLLTQNSKMKKSSGNIYNFGIPAYRSSTGMMTCPYAGKCASGCYARSGTYQFSTVKAAYEYRLAQTLLPNFPEIMVAEITRRKITKVRIHDSGDFYSLEYLKKWLAIITTLPHVQFYAYTKSIPFFASVTVPSNFHVIFSEGGKLDSMIPDGYAHSRVFENENELLNAGYTDVSNNDDLVYTTNLVGLVYHGNKNFNNTQWGSK